MKTSEGKIQWNENKTKVNVIQMEEVYFVIVQFLRRPNNEAQCVYTFL